MISSLPSAVRLTLALSLAVTALNPLAAQVSVTISPSTITLGAHSQFADPLYANITTQPYKFDLASGSPALNVGTNLGVNTVGVLDYAGNARVNGSGQINMGAYEQ